MRPEGNHTRKIAWLNDSPSATLASRQLAASDEWTVITGSDSPDPVPSASSSPDVIVVPLAYVASGRVAPGHTSLHIAYGAADELDRAFLLGADDFLVEPWSVLELIARVDRAGLLRLERQTRLRIDRALAAQTGAANRVTPRARRLLEFLLRRPGSVVDRATLARHVCGDERAAGTSRALDMTVSRLRPAIEPLGLCIETVRGIGYRIASSRVSEPGHDVDNLWSN